MARSSRARYPVLIIVLAALLTLSSLGFNQSPLYAQSTACSPVTATITAPFSFDGAGTFCWQSSNLGNNINSWNLASLTVNGVNFTNTFAFTSNLPPKAADGFWYVSYTGNFPWSHFEAAGTGGPTPTTGPSATPTRTPTVGGPTNTPTRTATTGPTNTPTPTPTSGNTRPSAGCGRTRTLQNGTHTIQSGGVNRTYILTVPSNYNNTNPYRLVFGYHWLNGTATDVATGQTIQRDVWAYYGLLTRSNNTAIFIAPQGIDNGWANTNGRDLTFTDAILTQVLNDLCIDQSRIFATGWSFGGAMSFALACARPNVFRAVAVISGGQLSGCSGGTSPVAYLGLHGINDSVLNISGGRTMRDRFVRNNGYTLQNPPEPAPGSLTHICTKYQGGLAAFPVEWCAFDGDHMPAPQDGATGNNGTRTWVPGETWAFFTQF
jgi:poly(3-hydroxybutyrate) depolymerase